MAQIPMKIPSPPLPDDAKSNYGTYMKKRYHNSQPTQRNKNSTQNKEGKLTTNTNKVEIKKREYPNKILFLVLILAS